MLSSGGFLLFIVDSDFSNKIYFRYFDKWQLIIDLFWFNWEFEFLVEWMKINHIVLKLYNILFPQNHTFFSLDDLFQKSNKNEVYLGIVN